MNTGEGVPVPGEAGGWMKWSAPWKRPDTVLAWPWLRQDLPDGQWSFYSAGGSDARDLDARQDLLKLKTGFTF